MKINFSPELFHIYDSLGIHTYGLFIALAIIIGIWALRRNKKFKELKLEDNYINIMFVAIIAGYFGGRCIEIISEWNAEYLWYDLFTFWRGGFSILGSIIGIIIVMPFYLKRIDVPILPLFDLVSIYAPLMQSIARLGCFTAGCCYGIPTVNIFSVVYTHYHSLAPHHIALHPTQLYSSMILFFIFLYLYCIAQYTNKKPGYLFILYLILISCERFLVDFWRAERIMVTQLLSFHQLIAIAIVVGAIIFRMLTLKKNTT